MMSFCEKVVSTKESFPMLRFSLLILLLTCAAATALAADVPSGDVFGGLSIDHTASDNSAITLVGWQANAAFNVIRQSALWRILPACTRKTRTGRCNTCLVLDSVDRRNA